MRIPKTVKNISSVVLVSGTLMYPTLLRSQTPSISGLEVSIGAYSNSVHETQTMSYVITDLRRKEALSEVHAAIDRAGSNSSSGELELFSIRLDEKGIRRLNDETDLSAQIWHTLLFLACGVGLGFIIRNPTRKRRRTQIKTGKL